MTHFRILIACFTGLILSACDTQHQSAPDNKTTEIKTTEIKTAPEKTNEHITSVTKTRPALKLSIDDISIEQYETGDTHYLKDEEPAEQTSALFEKRVRDKHNISFSGKVFTDENKLENKEYRDSVEGLQINLEGNFD